MVETQDTFAEFVEWIMPQSNPLKHLNWKQMWGYNGSSTNAWAQRSSALSRHVWNETQSSPWDATFPLRRTASDTLVQRPWPCHAHCCLGWLQRPSFCPKCTSLTTPQGSLSHPRQVSAHISPPCLHYTYCCLPFKITYFLFPLRMVAP